MLILWGGGGNSNSDKDNADSDTCKSTIDSTSDSESSTTQTGKAEAFVNSLPDYSNRRPTQSQLLAKDLQNNNLGGEAPNSKIQILRTFNEKTAKLTESSANHLVTKHCHNLGINDKLPPNPNQKPTNYEQVRTRVNGENRNQFVHEAQAILNDAQFIESFPDIEIRGIKGRGYVYDNPDYPGINQNNNIAGLFFGIHEEGIFAGQIKKVQPITQAQLERLRTEQRID